MNNKRLIPRLDIKGPNLVKGIHLEGLRVLGKPEDFAKLYYEQGADELIYQDTVASLYQRNSLSEIDTGDYLYNGDKLIFSRSSLQLILDKGRNQKLQYQCELVNHEDLYSFVEKQNASITSQNKF